MKISFLIPTKNRLDLVKHAVGSILAQDKIDLEIVISDNCSDDDYAGYVDSLEDSRVVYRRLGEAVSVTKNWQSALDMSSGDYILMMGDDDAVTPNFQDDVAPWLNDRSPDVVYLAAYHYGYPNVLAFMPPGYLAVVRNSEFLDGKHHPFCLTKSYADALADSMFAFRSRFGINAQHFLVRSTFAKSFASRGGFYQSPYPDTFSSLLVLRQAQTILVVPKETVIIGISPKSFGAYYFANRQDEGYKFLANEQEENDLRSSLACEILPGDRNNTNWLVAASAARRLTGGVPLDLQRYRILQVVAALRAKYVQQGADPSILAELLPMLGTSERSLVELLDAALTAATCDPVVLYEVLQGIEACLGQFHKAYISMIDIGEHRSISDAVQWLRTEPGRAPHGIGTPTATTSNVASERTALLRERHTLIAERDRLSGERDEQDSREKELNSMLDRLRVEQARLVAEVEAEKATRDGLTRELAKSRKILSNIASNPLWRMLPASLKRRIGTTVSG